MEGKCEMLILPTRCFRKLPLLIFAVSLVGAVPCFGSVTLLMEKPYGEFGSFNPTGHAAVYLNAAEAPASVDKARVIELRRDYWKDHLTSLAPPDNNGDAPPGEWVQLVGSSYDRTIHGFQVKPLPNRTNGS
jgi:hypothetical protein